MTATPIPRTLLMTHYGDLDVSRLTEKPAGPQADRHQDDPGRHHRAPDRPPARAARRGRAGLLGVPADRELRQVGAGRRRGAARASRPDVRRRATSACCTAAMPDKAKDATMAAFAANRLKILVATTVIEVGVDVPNANIMVIEHAERFGLAQLHQLRGRVGRGTRESFCMLLYKRAARRDRAPAPGDDGGDRGRLPDRREGPGAARRRRGAGRAPERHARVPRRRGAGLRRAAGGRPRRRPPGAGPGPELTSPRGEALRCCSTCSNATRPCACSAPRRRCTACVQLSRRLASALRWRS